MGHGRCTVPGLLTGHDMTKTISTCIWCSSGSCFFTLSPIIITNHSAMAIMNQVVPLPPTNGAPIRLAAMPALPALPSSSRYTFTWPQPDCPTHDESVALPGPLGLPFIHVVLGVSETVDTSSKCILLPFKRTIIPWNAYQNAQVISMRRRICASSRQGPSKGPISVWYMRERGRLAGEEDYH